MFIRLKRMNDQTNLDSDSHRYYKTQRLQSAQLFACRNRWVMQHAGNSPITDVISADSSLRYRFYYSAFGILFKIELL